MIDEWKLDCCPGGDLAQVKRQVMGNSTNRLKAQEVPFRCLVALSKPARRWSPRFLTCW